MKNFINKTVVFLLAVSAITGNAQEVPAKKTTNYSYVEAFAPNFYTKNGTETRSASGQPGAKYWQNRADYQINMSLNDKTNEIYQTKSQEEILDTINVLYVALTRAEEQLHIISSYKVTAKGEISTSKTLATYFINFLEQKANFSIEQKDYVFAKIAAFRYQVLHIVIILTTFMIP